MLNKVIYRISASQLMTYERCPRKVYYSKVEKIPTPDYHFFKFGHEVEEYFVRKYNDPTFEFTLADTMLCAKALYENKRMQELLDGETMTHGRKYRSVKCKDCKQWTTRSFEKEDPDNEAREMPCIHCGSENIEDYGLVGITDLETSKKTIDLKTTATSRTQQTILDKKRQVKMYKHFNGKEQAFAVVNKKTKKVEVYEMNIASLDDLYDKIEELVTAYRQNFFVAIPKGRECAQCAFTKICSKK